MYLMVFNPGPLPVDIDDAGRVVHPGDWAAADELHPSVGRHLAAGRLLVTDTERVSEKHSARAAVLVKQEVDRLNYTEPATAAPPTPTVPAKTATRRK